MNRETYQMIERVKRYGVSEVDAWALRRCAMTLHRWFEAECGDSNERMSWSIERDEVTDLPYRVCHWYARTGTSTGYEARTTRERIPDRETGARKRIAAIMQAYPGLVAYVQTDPRGAPLWLVPVDKIGERGIECSYSQGVAIYK